MAENGFGDSIEVIARRAIDRSTLRASVLLDRDLIIRWAQPTISSLLRLHPAQAVGRSALDFLHPDDVQTVAEILQFEQTIDVSIRSAVEVRSVRQVRVRCGDGVERSFEATLSNQFDVPDVGHLLIDLQAPSQLQHAYRAIEMTRRGAEVRDILAVVLSELTGGDPGGVASALIDSHGALLAASSEAPSPWGAGDPNRFAHSWTVPLIDSSSDHPSGVLQVWTALATPHPFDVEASHRIAGHAALVISRDRSLQELRAAALVDPLTGLANRRSLEAEIGSRRNAGISVLAAYIDLDGFKSVNDRIGHDAGDEVLRVVAQRLRRCLRTGDVVARMGGDEFVLLLSVPAPQGDSLIERLQRVIATPMVIGGEMISITASIGVSVGCDTAPDVVRFADQAMLERKRSRSRLEMTFT